jgi:transketolase
MQIVYKGENDPKVGKDVLSAMIPALAAQDPNFIYLDADLMSCIGTTKWAQANPDRAINCGIAEANMVGIAAGLSSVGFKPLVHTFGPFASRRCYDQAFLSGGYAKNPITIVGTDSGVTAAFNGGTHMPFEDMALYTAMPEATVLDVSDAAQFESVLQQVSDLPGVKYIRVPRKGFKKIYADGEQFEIGKGAVLKDGMDAVIFACGIMVAKALDAAATLEEEGISAAVVDLFTVKPLDAELVLSYAKKTGAVVTAENHNHIGGLTSAVTALLAAKLPTPVEYVAVEDVFGEVGPQDYLEKQFGLTAEHIVSQVKAVIARK